MKYKFDSLDGVSFFNGLIFFAPVALFVRTQAGVSLSQFFILQALLSGVIFLGEIPAGFVTDRIGYRNSMIFSQVLLFTARILLLLAFLSKSLPLFVLEVFVEGICCCFSSGTDSAYIYQIYGKDRYLDKISHTRNFGTLGFILSTLSYAGIYAWLGISGLLIATCISSGCGIICALLLKKDNVEHISIKEITTPPIALVKELIHKPQAWAFTIGLSSFSISWILINFFYAERLVSCQIDEKWLTAVILLYSAIQMLAEPILNKLKGKNKNHILFVFSILAAVLMITFGYVKNPFLVIALMLILPLAINVPEFLLGERENDFIDHIEAERQRATALSILNMGVNLLEIVALFSSAFFAKIGIGTCFLMVGVLLGVVAVWLVYMLEKNEKTKRLSKGVVN
jgi:MFS family permease